MNTTTNQAMINPYQGVRAFEELDSYKYFGRQNDIQQVKKLLHHHHFVALIGESGIGKTSLIQCGLINELKKSKTYEVFKLRPGRDCLHNLLNIFNKHSNDLKDLKQDDNYLYKILEQKAKLSDHSLLIFIDQFEELFYQEEFNYKNIEEYKNNTETFINQITHALTNRKENQDDFYLIISLRLDFLDSCKSHLALDKWIKQGGYHLSHMLNSEIQEAIQEPVFWLNNSYGFNIAFQKGLVNEMITDIRGDSSRLVLMQLVMSEIFKRYVVPYFDGSDKQRFVINLDHYHEVGGINKCLPKLAEDIYHSLGNQKTQSQVRSNGFVGSFPILFQRKTGINQIQEDSLCTKVFKAITHITKGGQKVRRPITEDELCNITLVEKDDLTSQDLEHHKNQVQSIIEKYRDLLIAEHRGIGNNNYISLNHESLINKWDWFNEWIVEEAKAIKLYADILEMAKLWRQGSGGLLQKSVLESVKPWWFKSKPNKFWGMRYSTEADFYLVKNFIEQSLKVEEDVKKYDDEVNKKRLKRLQILTVSFSVFALIFLIGLIIINFQKQDLILKENSLQKTNKDLTDTKALLLNRNKDLTDTKALLLNRNKDLTDTQDTLKDKNKQLEESLKKEEIATYRAKMNELEAIKQQTDARLSRLKAQTEKSISLSLNKELNKERDNLVKQYKLYLSRILAIESLRINPGDKKRDIDINFLRKKVLLAVHAYYLDCKNQSSGVIIDDADNIFNAIYEALKALEKSVSDEEISNLGFNTEFTSSKDARFINSSDNEFYFTDSKGRLLSYKILNEIKNNFGINKNINLDALYQLHKKDKIHKNKTQYQWYSTFNPPINKIVASSGSTNSNAILLVLNADNEEVEHVVPLKKVDKSIFRTKYLDFTYGGFLISHHQVEGNYKTVSWKIDEEGKLEFVDADYPMGDKIIVNKNWIVINDSKKSFRTHYFKIGTNGNFPESTISLGVDSGLKTMALHNNKLVRGYSNGKINLYNLSSETGIGQKRLESEITNICFNQQGDNMAVSSGNVIYLFGATINKIRNKPIRIGDFDEKSEIISFIFSKDDSFLRVCYIKKGKSYIKSLPIKVEFLIKSLSGFKKNNMDIWKFQDSEWDEYFAPYGKDIDDLKPENNLKFSELLLRIGLSGCE